MTAPVRLTQFSHGAGCGCKISPALLKEIVGPASDRKADDQLLVGNETSDDAAVFDVGHGQAVISTIDFFMPIVDDPFDFGRIAVTNAISDVYAMGGRPIMAVAVLGWPIEKLAAHVAAEVVAGGRKACSDAGVTLAGGHSIDSPEPIFGAAVTGVAAIDQIRRNSTAQPGDILYLTKPLGIGVLTTAEKKGLLQTEHQSVATDWMCRPNDIGIALAAHAGVHAMTDVTGFGLLGHLLEMCRGSGLTARIESNRIPMLPGVAKYIEQGCVPGGTRRNFASYGAHVGEMTDDVQALLCDPQTSGGLLVAVSRAAQPEVEKTFRDAGLELQAFGQMRAGPPMVELG